MRRRPVDLDRTLARDAFHVQLRSGKSRRPVLRLWLTPAGLELELNSASQEADRKRGLLCGLLHSKEGLGH